VSTNAAPSTNTPLADSAGLSSLRVKAFDRFLPQPITKPELAQFLRVSERTVDNYVASRRIPYIKIGRSIRFQLADVQKALKKFTVREIA
jgi:excisionase family DNA binding protein